MFSDYKNWTAFCQRSLREVKNHSQKLDHTAKYPKGSEQNTQKQEEQPMRARF
jgi:hypothetical protein